MKRWVQKEDYFQRLEPSRVPKGSSILGELSLAALTSLVDRELHLRYLHLAHSASVRLDDSLRSGVWEDEKRPQEIDIISIFPRLVYRRSTSDRPPHRSGDFWPRRRWRDLRIELFKPIGIADLAEHASSRRWRNANDGHAVELPKTPLHLLDDVTELIIRKGGALRPSAPGVPSDPTPRPDLAEFDIAISLMIEEPIADDRTSATFDVILDLMALATADCDKYELRNATRLRRFGDGVQYAFELTCHPDVYAAFIRSVSSLGLPINVSLIMMR